MDPEFHESRRPCYCGSKPREGWEQQRKCQNGDAGQHGEDTVCGFESNRGPMMKAAIVFVAITAACAVSLSAQWPKYQEPGIPRNAAGEALMDSPAPRTPDG